MGEIINFFNIKNGLLIDSVAWIIFGLLWIGIPNTLLTTNFGVRNYDWITVHMTQAFGLFCLFSGVGVCLFKCLFICVCLCMFI